MPAPAIRHRAPTLSRRAGGGGVSETMTKPTTTLRVGDRVTFTDGWGAGRRFGVLVRHYAAVNEWLVRWEDGRTTFVRASKLCRLNDPTPHPEPRP